MKNSPHFHEYLPVKRNNTLQKIRRIIYAAILAASAINTGCAPQQKAKTIKYESAKSAKVEIVKRPVYYCSSSIKDVKNEAKRCVGNVLIAKKEGLHCLECTTEVEQLKY